MCGQTVYNRRRPFDQDRLRWACQASTEFIAGPLQRRRQPATHRSAMAGRDTGGPVPWGSVVDDDQRSAGYPHVIASPRRRSRSSWTTSCAPAPASRGHRGWVWRGPGSKRGAAFPSLDRRSDPHVVRAAAGRQRDEVRDG
jgi:hypothetical protein